MKGKVVFVDFKKRKVSQSSNTFSIINFVKTIISRMSKYFKNNSFSPARKRIQ